MVKKERKQTKSFAAWFPEIDISHLESAIIAGFFPEGEEMTIKEIQERTDYSYERTNSGLKSLVEKKILAEEKIGKTLIYSLDLKSPYAYSLGFNAYTLQREIDFIKKHKSLFGAIKEIETSPYVFGIFLFGSYSKDSQTNESDIDLLFLSTKPKETESLIRSLKHKYGFGLSPVVVLPHEFPDIKKDNPELWNDLKMYGIAFKGTDYFYYWMYKDEKS